MCFEGRCERRTLHRGRRNAISAAASDLRCSWSWALWHKVREPRQGQTIGVPLIGHAENWSLKLEKAADQCALTGERFLQKYPS